VTYDEPESPELPVVPLVMDRAVSFCREMRLLELRYAVHRFDAGSPDALDAAGAALPERTPTYLCVYRAPEMHDAHTLELTRSAHALLSVLRDGSLALTLAIRQVATQEGLTLDEPFLAATSALLADLSSRGVLLGSRG
jgi:hypothetical protein